MRTNPSQQSHSQTRQPAQSFIGGQVAHTMISRGQAVGSGLDQPYSMGHKAPQSKASERSKSRAVSNQSRSAEENARKGKRALSSNKMLSNQQHQMYSGGYVGNSSATTISNQSTSAGGTAGLWKNNGNNNNSQQQQKLMRDPDQIRSQMINKLGTNNSSSTMFNNNILLNNSALVPTTNKMINTGGANKLSTQSNMNY